MDRAIRDGVDRGCDVWSIRSMQPRTQELLSTIAGSAITIAEVVLSIRIVSVCYGGPIWPRAHQLHERQG